MRIPIDRRQLLQGVAAATVAAAAERLVNPPFARAELAPVRRVGGPRIKLALNAYSFSKLLNNQLKGRDAGISLPELVDFCAKQGFEGLDATGYFFPGYPNVPDESYVNQLKRRAFDLGIGISGTGVRNNFTTADQAVRAAGVQHIKQWVEVAARLGAPVLRVFADTQMKGQTWQSAAPGCTRDQVEEWIAGHLRDCAEHGARFGVIIGVQNHGDFLQTSADHLRLVRRVDSPWCGPIVDTGYYKSDDPYQDMAAVAPYAVNWQIKESPFGAGNPVRTDLKKLLTLIRLASYRGYLPVETLSASGQAYDPYDVVPKFLAELREAVEATASVMPAATDERPPDAAPAVSSAPASSIPTAATGEPGAASASEPRRTRKPPNKNKNRPATSPSQADAQ